MDQIIIPLARKQINGLPPPLLPPSEGEGGFEASMPPYMIMKV